MKLYQYAVIYIPAKDSEDKAVIVLAPTNILAKDERSVLVQVSRLIPPEYSEKLDRVEIAIRPF